jgi:hypothetical protein
VLTNPFQHGKNLTQASTSTEGGSQETYPPPSNSSSVNIYMVKGDAFITTRAHDYSKPSTSEKGKEDELPSLPLQIKKTLGETMACIPKGAIKKASHNPNARATHNYSVLEDLSQTPCAMSALEVLQSYLAQRKALLTTLGSTETCNPGTIMLDTTDLKPRLPYHVAFQIVVAHPMKIFYTKYISHGGRRGRLDMRYVVSMLEGHWPAHFVSIIYSPHCVRRSFFPTTWHHSFFPCAVKREDCVCRSRGSRCSPRL